jgi:hypothetical protein
MAVAAESDDGPRAVGAIGAVRAVRPVASRIRRRHQRIVEVDRPTLAPAGDRRQAD